MKWTTLLVAANYDSFMKRHNAEESKQEAQNLSLLFCLFVLRFYGTSTQWGHVERG